MPELTPAEAVLAVTGVILLLALTIPATWFPIAYAARSNWQASRTGRGLLFWSAMFAVAIDMTALFSILQIGLGAPSLTAQAVVFVLLNWAAWYQVVNLRRAQAADRRWEARQDDEEHHPGPPLGHTEVTSSPEPERGHP